jgi:uncharacterized protein (TIGR02145 family)
MYPYNSSSSSWQGSQGSYVYCLRYIGGSYSCDYISVSACNGANNYGNDNTCGGYSSGGYQALEGCPDASVGLSTVTCGGKTYSTVKIGTQTWMAENLNYNASGSRCYGDNTGGDSQGNCTTYGRLYNWATAMGISSGYNSISYNPSSSTKYRGVCPSGWHIPNGDEWNALTTYIENNKSCTDCDAKHLKAQSGWYNDGNGEDSYDFSALPGGGGVSGGLFIYAGTNGYWWSATEYDGGYAYSRGMHYYYDEGDYWDDDYKNSLYSVRCLQD